MAEVGCLAPEEANAFLSTNENLISKDIARNLELNTPWLSVFETDTWDAGESTVKRSVVQQNVCAANTSLALPSLPNWTCEFAPKQLTMDTCEYQYRIKAQDFVGPTFCVATDHNSFRGAIRSSENTLKTFSFDFWNALLREAALGLSGTKAVAVAGAQTSANVTRGFQTPFKPGVTPDGRLSFQMIVNLKNYMRNVVLAGPANMYGSGNTMHYKFIGSDELIESLRNEAIADLRALATGGFQDGAQGVRGFMWEGPFRGVAFGVDQTPIRLAQVPADGVITAADVVEPRICVEGANGQLMGVTNPAWESAPYEISFLIARGALFREMPAQLLGEGNTRFDKQFWGGQVQWINNKDMKCNPTGDRGYHLLRYAFAMRPVYPQFVTAILSQRCVDDSGVIACTAPYYSGDVDVVAC